MQTSKDSDPAAERIRDCYSVICKFTVVVLSYVFVDLRGTLNERYKYLGQGHAYYLLASYL